MKNRIALSLLVFLLIFNFQSMGQQTVDNFFIRSFNHSLSVKIKQSTYYKYCSNESGKTLLNESDHSYFDRYQFQNQEIDDQLGIYLFPSRIYQPLIKRFFQVDPENQYFSPYVFVGGDPVNVIDLDGNAGRPLVLYQEDHNFRKSMEPGTVDLKNAVPDAHYVPMSDFINQQVGDLPEWNGSVFLKGHLGDTPGREVLVESGRDRSMLKSRAGTIAQEAEYNEQMGKNLVLADSRDMGRMLRRFSDERGVPIKSVFAGGCQGSYATEGIRDGFMEESKRIGLRGQRIKFHGLKSGYKSLYVGEKSHKLSKYDSYPKQTRYYVNKADNERGPHFVTKADGKREFVGYNSKEAGVSKFKADPFVTDKDMGSMVNEGRVPGKLKSFFNKIVEFY